MEFAILLWHLLYDKPVQPEFPKMPIVYTEAQATSATIADIKTLDVVSCCSTVPVKSPPALISVPSHRAGQQPIAPDTPVDSGKTYENVNWYVSVKPNPDGVNFDYYCEYSDPQAEVFRATYPDKNEGITCKP